MNCIPLTTSGKSLRIQTSSRRASSCSATNWLPQCVIICAGWHGNTHTHRQQDVPYFIRLCVRQSLSERRTERVCGLSCKCVTIVGAKVDSTYGRAPHKHIDKHTDIDARRKDAHIWVYIFRWRESVEWGFGVCVCVPIESFSGFCEVWNILNNLCICVTVVNICFNKVCIKFLR